MRDFFAKHRVISIVIGLFIAVGLMAGSIGIRNNRNTPTIVQQIGNTVVGWFGGIVNYPMNSANGTVSSLGQILNAYSENKTLKKKVSALEQTQTTNETLKKENKQLKAELELNNSLTDYTTITAAVTNRTPSAWENQLIINKGSSSGVKKNMAVLSGSGLIGRIVEVNPTNSKVELISSSSESTNQFSVAVDNEDGDTVNGLISGYDTKTSQLVMSEVSSSAAVKKGAKVTTNGLGGVTPKGLYVGKVVKTTKGSGGEIDRIYVEPATNLNDVNYVTIAELNED
ncbi:Rod shape-determining protein MreC [Limosilactobacillus gastricus PS3]|uniref:Cell shape-determining protein MreC n=2 Tax=Limosilactobacillus gastricus TaxID=227942 RepID=H4GLB0_9LACO|nr:rod shape-determining protein MreC [Limosilactobacillus gastricus]EHS84609.1 Rod shape-determining protein MreC [Limosilactobacillus gastricus PS3]KRM03464.1 Rod shape-determining protein MreC [Limosilactobacillus gastricus DSM 16045]QGF40828.1 rod shape-determining protein MreC [Limosilactobacillus gastricus]